MDEALRTLIPARELELKVVYLVAIWLEAIIYGIYLCLYLGVISVLIGRRALGSFPSKVFLVGNTVMFALISIHNGQNLYRLIAGYAYQVGVRAPVVFLGNMENWTTYSAPVLLGLILWTGDALVIYRCFLVWDRNWWIVAPSMLLFAASLGSQAANFWWSRYQPDISTLAVTAWPFLNAAFPLYLAQNTVTTSLILFRIWLQSRETKAAGIAPLYTPSLIKIMRIIIESAAIYTTGMLVMVVVRALDHTTRAIAHCCLVPITGITFVLMAMRTHALREAAKNAPASASLLPTWLLAVQEHSVDIPSIQEQRMDLPSSLITLPSQPPLTNR